MFCSASVATCRTFNNHVSVTAKISITFLPKSNLVKPCAITANFDTMNDRAQNEDNLHTLDSPTCARTLILLVS